MIVCENCIHRYVCEDKYTMKPQYACINYNSGKHIFIEELEKIKAEIENMWIKSAKDLKTGEVIYENLCEHSEVLEIINNHISELKGENNG